MPTTVPASYSKLDGVEYRTRRPIRASDWQAIAHGQNYLYSVRGERISGIEFYNPFTTTSTIYTSLNGNVASDGNLDEWRPVFLAKKRITSFTSLAARFSLEVYGTYYDMSWVVTEAVSGALVDSGTLVNSTATRQWSTATIEVPHLNTYNEDGTPKLLYLEVAVRRSVGANATIHQIHLRGKTLTASELPSSIDDWDQMTQPLRTFTPAGATGYLGPTQAQLDAAYLNTALEGEVTSLWSGHQIWTVPFTGNWRIRAKGAGFDGVSNQRGADIAANFSLLRGQQLRIIVGQVGNNIRCGSGGSFVGIYDFAATDTMTIDSIKVKPLVVAGGAGGTLTANVAAIGGQTGNNGANSSTAAVGGTGGLGGAGAGFAIGGAGWRGNGGGGDGTAPYNATRAFINGGWGNLAGDTTPGSFGGGGTGRLATNYRFGGGGGFGGGAAAQTSLSTGYGGGGGSYIDAGGYTTSSTAASNIGDGSVEISYVGY